MQGTNILILQALTLEKLAANNIVHRDMKPHNVVWANDGTPKIIDFGLAAISDGPLTENCGTEAYLAPEVARKENYGSEVDEWSWEVAHFEMVTGVVSNVCLSSHVARLMMMLYTVTFRTSWRYGDQGAIKHLTVSSIERGR